MLEQRDGRGFVRAQRAAEETAGTERMPDGSLGQYNPDTGRWETAPGGEAPNKANQPFNVETKDGKVIRVNPGQPLPPGVQGPPVPSSSPCRQSPLLRTQYTMPALPSAGTTRRRDCPDPASGPQAESISGAPLYP